MSKQLAQAVTLYSSFREAKPTKLARVPISIPKIVACMGYVEGIDYTTTHNGKAVAYHHDFAAGSRPLLCVSADGKQLMLLGGFYKWTERGIVDHDAKGRARPDPKHGRSVNPIKSRRETERAFMRRQLSEIRAVKKARDALNVYLKATQKVSK